MPHLLHIAQHFLAIHGLMLLLGSSVLLACGCAVSAILRRGSPLHAQRAAEAATACAGVWIVLACCPLPRLDVSGPTRSVREPAPAAAVATPPPVVSALSPQEIDEILASVQTIDRGRDVERPAAITNTPRMAITPPAPAANESTSRDNLPLDLARLYLAGAMAALLWLGLGQLLLWRLQARARPADDRLQRMLRTLVPRHAAAPRLLISDACGRPLSFGVRRPTIVLPSSCTQCEAQLRHVLLHEIGHLRQGDAWGNALFNGLLPVLWMHPLYWLLRGQVSLCRELVADDWAARHGDKTSYIRELIALARRQTRCSGRHVPAIGLFRAFRFNSDFYRRMHMLIERSEGLPTRCSGIWRIACAAACGVALLGGAAVLGVRPAQADDSVKDALAKVVSSQQSTSAESVATTDPNHSADSEPPLENEVVDATEVVTASATDPTDRLEEAEAADDSGEHAKSKDPTQKHQKRSKRDQKQATRTQTTEVRNNREAKEANANQAAQEAIALEIEKLNHELETVQARAQQQMEEVQAQLEMSQQQAETQMEKAREQLARAQDAFAENGNKNEQDRERAKAQGELQKAQQELEMYRGLATDAKKQHFRQSMDSVTQTAQRERDEWLNRKLALASRLDAARVAAKDARWHPDIADSSAVGRRANAIAQGPAQLDLVSLAMSYSDAVGEVMIAQAQSQKTHAETQEPHVLALSQANLAKAQNKAALLRQMAEIAADAARKDLVRTHELHKSGGITDVEVQEIETRVKILEAILNPRGGDLKKF